MRVRHQTYAGIDVHKKDGKICLGIRDSEGRCQEAVQSFRTLTRDLLAMHTWLQTQEYTLIATEYIGVYRKPMFNGSSTD
jgi:hypothetical protein